MGCVVGVLLAPVGIVGGALYGGSKAEPDWTPYDLSSVAGAREFLEQNLNSRNPHVVVSQEVVSWLPTRIDNDVQIFSYRGDPETIQPENSMTGMIQIGLSKLGLVIQGKFNEGDNDPPAAILIGITATIYEESEGKFVRRVAGYWEYLGGTHKFSRLKDNHENILDDEIKNAAYELAKHIVQ